MESLFENLEKHIMAHLESISNEADKEGGFACPQMVCDMHALLDSLRDMYKIRAMAKTAV